MISMLSDPQFWVAVAFVIFVLVLYKPVKKILSSSLDAQINEIKESIEEAENLRNETQITLSNIKKRQSEVDEEIKEIHSKAKEKMKILESQSKEKFEAQSSKRELLAKTKIDQMIQDANLLIQQEISLTAVDTAVALLVKKLNQEEKQNLINESIKDLSLVLKN